MGKIKYNDIPLFEGKEIWACALVHNNPGGNASVHLKPTKVIIKKYISSYGGPAYFKACKLDKKGNQKKYNYGFEIEKDDSLDGTYNYHFFENELDCLECYSELSKKVLEDFEIWWDKKQLWASKKITEYKKYIL